VPRGAKKPVERRRVVAVDDDHDFLTVLRSMLAKEFEVTVLSDGEDLMGQLEAVQPDLLILDVRMPKPDGFELCRRVRSSGSFHSLPVLFLSASDTDGDFFQNMDSGGTAYLTKPVSRRRLLSKVTQLLQA